MANQEEPQQQQPWYNRLSNGREGQVRITPPGYRLTVFSCEGDMKSQNTLGQAGLTADQCEMLVQLLKLLRFTQHRRPVDGFGNMFDPTPERVQRFREAVRDILIRYPQVPEAAIALHALADDDELQPAYDEATRGLSGTWSERFYTRWVMGILVEIIPQEIRTEDVTHAFIDLPLPQLLAEHEYILK